MLADLIGSGAVPVIRLTEIFRQAAESGIVRNAHRINRGELPAFARADDGPADCYGIRVTGPEDAEAKLLELVTARIPERFGLDPVNDVQVLTPMNRGRMGTQSLNELLQAHLNPDPPLVLHARPEPAGAGRQGDAAGERLRSRGLQRRCRPDHRHRPARADASRSPWTAAG